MANVDLGISRAFIQLAQKIYMMIFIITVRLLVSFELDMIEYFGHT